MADPATSAAKSELTYLLTSYVDADSASVIITFVVGGMKKGSLIDVYDTVGRWYVSLIIDTKADEAMIHYIGWPSRWREWIPFNSSRITPFGDMTGGKLHIGSSFGCSSHYLRVGQLVHNPMHHYHNSYGRIVSIDNRNIKIEHDGKTKTSDATSDWYIANKAKNYTCGYCRTFYGEIELYCKVCGLTVRRQKVI